MRVIEVQSFDVDECALCGLPSTRAQVDRLVARYGPLGELGLDRSVRRGGGEGVPVRRVVVSGLADAHFTQFGGRSGATDPYAERWFTHHDIRANRYDREAWEAANVYRG